MKKMRLFSVAFIMLTACNNKSDYDLQLQTRIDSLETKLANTYKPGFGEFMTAVQNHHSKLWFAGMNQNWKLADFEIHEIKEVLTDIQTYQTERVESKFISMMNPQIDSLTSAIEQNSPIKFKNSFTQLTNRCNDCHRATSFEFNIVKIPDISPFTNQNFNLEKAK